MEKEACPKCGLTSNMNHIISIPDHGHCPFVKCNWVKGKTLKETNPNLADGPEFIRTMRRNIDSSSAIEEVPGTRTYHRVKK